MHGEPFTASVIYYGDLPASQVASVAAINVDWATAQKRQVTLATSVTGITFDDPKGVSNLMLAIIQDGVGGHGIATSAWPGNVVWPGGTKPVFGNGPNALRLLSLYFDGVRYWAQDVAQVFS